MGVVNGLAVSICLQYKLLKGIVKMSQMKLMDGESLLKWNNNNSEISHLLSGH